MKDADSSPTAFLFSPRAVQSTLRQALPLSAEHKGAELAPPSPQGVGGEEELNEGSGTAELGSGLWQACPG